jgi:hypothetical protein
MGRKKQTKTERAEEAEDASAVRKDDGIIDTDMCSLELTYVYVAFGVAWSNPNTAP